MLQPRLSSKILLTACLSCLSLSSLNSQASEQPTHIGDLFQALKQQPQTQLDQLAIQQSEIAKQAVTAKFYPELNAFAQATTSNHLKNLKPAAPKDLRPGKDFPFAYNIYGYGIEAKMPLFVASLFELKKKAEKLHQASQIQYRLNLLQNEALLVGYNAQLQHLKDLKAALEGQQRSLQESRAVVKIKVDSGRSPASQLTNMDEHLNQLNQKLLGLTIQKQKVQSQIYQLTHINLPQPLPMQWQPQALEKSQFLALQLVEKKKQAAEKGLQAAKSAYYPKVALFAQWSDNYGEAYNTHKNIDRDFGTLGVRVSVPLYNAGLSPQADKAQQAVAQAKLTQAKLQQELTAKAQILETTVKQLKSQEALAKTSVQNEQALLKTAKVAYRTGRMTQEEYLRYEDNLLKARANLSNIQANWWQAQATLAFIYGNNLEDLIQ